MVQVGAEHKPCSEKDGQGGSNGENKEGGNYGGG